MVDLKSVLLLCGVIHSSCSFVLVSNDTLGGNEGYEDDETSTKYLYFSNGAAFYETAAQDCARLLGGTLLNIETEEELKAVQKWLTGAAATSAWVGGVLKNNANCRKPQKFNEDCWEWNNKERINTELVPWHESTGDALQTRMSRAVFDGFELSIASNTISFRALCELKKEVSCGK